jgi:hypothetical protein
VTPTRPAADGRAPGTSADATPPSGSAPAPLPGDAAAAPAPVPAPPTCAAQAFTAKSIPIDLLLLLDRSGSMVAPTPGGDSKWRLAQQAIDAFVEDPGSTGLGVGLTVFPEDVPCVTDADCGPTGDLVVGHICRGLEGCSGAMGPGRAPLTCNVESANIVIPGIPLPPACPAGATCQALGHCAQGGGLCAPLGSACPAGEGACVAIARTCSGGSRKPGCGSNTYETPRVPIGDLPANGRLLINTLGVTQPVGDTPTLPAVQGALRHLQTRAGGRRGVLVLLTDGIPGSNCNGGAPGSTDATVIASVGAELAKAAAAVPSIPTYAIGVFADEDGKDGPAALAQWARAGGTGTPFVLSPGSDLGAKLLQALEQIRGAALPCEYLLPTASGAIDFGKLNLHYRGQGGDEDVGYVGSAARCDAARGGWYYDVDPAAGTPSRVVVCPATCSALRRDPQGSVEIRVGCKTRVIE